METIRKGLISQSCYNHGSECYSVREHERERSQLDERARLRVRERSARDARESGIRAVAAVARRVLETRGPLNGMRCAALVTLLTRILAGLASKRQLGFSKPHQGETVPRFSGPRVPQCRATEAPRLRRVLQIGRLRMSTAGPANFWKSSLAGSRTACPYCLLFRAIIVNEVERSSSWSSTGVPSTFPGCLHSRGRDTSRGSWCSVAPARPKRAIAPRAAHRDSS